MVKTLHFQCRGHGFEPRWRNLDCICCAVLPQMFAVCLFFKKNLKEKGDSDIGIDYFISLGSESLFSFFLFLKLLFKKHLKNFYLKKTSLVAQMVKNLSAMRRPRFLIPGSGRPPRVGDGNPLQDSCLENSVDRGDWRATVHGVA